MHGRRLVAARFAPEYLEARKNGLAAFLREVCRRRHSSRSSRVTSRFLVARRDAVNCRELQDFLTLRQRVPHLARPDASEPVQSAEVQEASFGIAAFDYDPVQGWLLLGSSDFSWTSRVDTKITWPRHAEYRESKSILKGISRCPGRRRRRTSRALKCPCGSASRSFIATTIHTILVTLEIYVQ